MNIGPHIIANGNWLSMDRYMELALFDEEGGYYNSNIADIGVRGDFSTSATISDLLARKLVAQWKKTCDACGRFLPFLEIGGGNGDLSMSISRSLGFFDKLRATYLMVDRSRTLRDFQKMAGGTFVRVYATIEEALKHARGRAFIFSNELPDAFPARQFVYQSGEWLELGLSVIEGKITRVATRRPLPASTVFSHWAREGQIVEVHESYHTWYAGWQKHWRCGSFVTIDYGESVDTLYYRRPHGSLRGYKAHQQLSIEELPPLTGHCDITADVNFTDLINLAKECPGDAVEYMSQRDFLRELAKPNHPGDQHLIAVPGAGDHFRVLIQHRFEL